MEKIIRKLINGYKTPVFLSDAGKNTVLYFNQAAEEKLGWTKDGIKELGLNELFENKQIIQHQTIWHHDDVHYLIEDEEFTLSGRTYIKSNIKPFQQGPAYYPAFQKEMVRRLIHRLRSPLNGASGFIELLDSRLKDGNEKQNTYLRSIEDGLEDLQSVLQHIEVLATDVHANIKTVDFDGLGPRIKTLFSKAQNRIEIIFDTKIRKQETDIFLLTSILRELVQNAIDHSDQDDSKITLTLRNDRIRIHNEGKPIPSTLSPYVFFPFYSSKAHQLGIGLAKCAYYADELGWRLKLAQNSEKQGVSFDIMF